MPGSKTNWWSNEILNFVTQKSTPSVLTGDITGGPPSVSVALFVNATPDDSWTSTEVVANEVDDTASTGDDTNYARVALTGAAWDAIIDADTATARSIANANEITMNTGGSSGESDPYNVTGWGIVDSNNNLYYWSDETATVNSGDVVKFTDAGLVIKEA